MLRHLFHRLLNWLAGPPPWYGGTPDEPVSDPGS
jgi:hypothetical protein